MAHAKDFVKVSRNCRFDFSFSVFLLWTWVLFHFIFSLSLSVSLPLSSYLAVCFRFTVKLHTLFHCVSFLHKLLRITQFRKCCCCYIDSDSIFLSFRTHMRTPQIIHIHLIYADKNYITHQLFIKVFDIVKVSIYTYKMLCVPLHLARSCVSNLYTFLRWNSIKYRKYSADIIKYKNVRNTSLDAAL